MAFAKLSLLLLYRRLSKSRWLDLSIWITTIVVLASSVAIMLALIFACAPIEKDWDITVIKGRCINKGALYMAAGATSVATDLILLLLPIPIVLKLQFPVVQKVALSGMFVVGAL